MMAAPNAPYRPSDFCEACQPNAHAIMRLFRVLIEYVCGPEEPATTTPEDTLRKAGISDKRQAEYQRQMSNLLAGRE